MSIYFARSPDTLEFKQRSINGSARWQQSASTTKIFYEPRVAAGTEAASQSLQVRKSDPSAAIFRAPLHPPPPPPPPQQQQQQQHDAHDSRRGSVGRSPEKCDPDPER
ncbi:hypothetical protein MYCTH_2129154 [Thermothelomyces thermophilus ATCC 42464]|uniref:Uncharacterized protein n=1 Tax=Thermothelomyces thermophilus (strain ATCC 42464 / BCRC 31852 / DSM 1799) TaxID=573729 RepID=G2QKF4_THET4|nr:uncharacterized protein MYCTH_2129154 [Thermothelomyces thermophilus ATCC 42464]AEO60060.1 hypothetical protein MYCTH_2129154 [Thermothelomyces thermophilus ATCC 42464]